MDGNGNLDALMIGNDYGMEPYSDRHYAFNGLYLRGDGKGNFKSVPLSKSGFFVSGDAKGLAILHTAENEDIFMATQNQDSIKVYAKNISACDTNQKWISLKQDDFSTDILFKNKKKTYRILFWFYLSASIFPKDIN